MTESIFTAEDFLRDIYEAEASLRWFEQKYGLLSETFHRLYHEGQLRDEEPAEIQEYLEWASWFDVYQDRRKRYDETIQIVNYFYEATVLASAYQRGRRTH